MSEHRFVKDPVPVDPGLEEHFASGQKAARAAAREIRNIITALNSAIQEAQQDGIRVDLEFSDLNVMGCGFPASLIIVRSISKEISL